MRLVIKEDYHGIAQVTAEKIRSLVTSFVPTTEKPVFVIAMPSGHTAVAIYERLAAMHAEGKVSFKNVCVFNLDEFVGIPRDHPHSQHTYMWVNLFSKVDFKRENIYFLDGNAFDLEIECRRFEAELARRGGLDFAFFSTGGNGQVARNEPGSSMASLTRAKTLAADTVEQLAQRWGVSNVRDVPKLTLTVGVGTLLAAKDVLVLFSGSKRARSLEAALEKGVNHMFPVSAFQRHPKVLFVCDEDATLELRVKTVEYFKGLEKTAKRLQGQGSVQESALGSENNKTAVPASGTTMNKAKRQCA